MNASLNRWGLATHGSASLHTTILSVLHMSAVGERQSSLAPAAAMSILAILGPERVGAKLSNAGGLWSASLHLWEHRLPPTRPLICCSWLMLDEKVCQADPKYTVESLDTRKCILETTFTTSNRPAPAASFQHSTT